MKINARHKLIPAVAMLVVAAIALTSASYAWFTMSRTVKAEGITLTAVAPSNLLISATNAENSYGETASITLNAGGHGLIPASSNDGVTMYAPLSITGSTGQPNKDTIFAATTTALAATDPDTPASADGYYVDIPLWIATEGTADVNIALSTSISSIEENNGDTTGAKQIADAVRFAVLTDASAQPATGSHLFSQSAPDYFADYTGNDSGSAVACNPVDKPGTGSAAFATTAATFLVHGDSNDGSGQTTLLTVPKQTSTTPALTTTNIKCFIRIWVEGQDQDCVNAALKTLKVTVGFKSVDFDESPA